jgi:hypothetical protein
VLAQVTRPGWSSSVCRYWWRWPWPERRERAPSWRREQVLELDRHVHERSSRKAGATDSVTAWKKSSCAGLERASACAREELQQRLRGWRPRHTGGASKT